MGESLMTNSVFYIHPTAEVSPHADIGAGTRIWTQVQVREHASIGEACNIGKGVYIDTHVCIGSGGKNRNQVSYFGEEKIEDAPFTRAQDGVTQHLPSPPT